MNISNIWPSHILVLLPYSLSLAVVGLCRAGLQTLQHVPQPDYQAWRPMLPSAALWMFTEAAFGKVCHSQRLLVTS